VCVGDSLTDQGRGLVTVTAVLVGLRRGVGRTVGVGGTGFGFGAGGGGLGVGVAGVMTPARTRGKSRTTASRVGSGVGCRTAARSAVAARGPPPHAAHKSETIASPVASVRKCMKASKSS
jgi:hypothetical protein